MEFKINFSAVLVAVAVNFILGFFGTQLFFQNRGQRKWATTQT